MMDGKGLISGPAASVIPAISDSTSPCSEAQARFWYEEQLQPGASARNVFARWRLEGIASTPQLAATWHELVLRHPSLRTSFANVEGDLVQVVWSDAALRVRDIDLTLLPLDAAEAEADRIAIVESQTSFDITVAPLIRVTHVRLAARRSILMVTAHHMVCDGWSLGILSSEMGALAGGFAAALAPLTFTYADYALRERKRLADSTFDEERAAIGKYLHGYRRFEIEPDFPRPAQQSGQGGIVSLLLDRELTSALAQLSRSCGCTLFMTSYALLAVLLARAAGDTDVALSTQVAGRDDVDFENVVGTFVNTIALRTQVAMDETFVRLLEGVRDSISDAFELRNVPLSVLIDVVTPKRDLGRSTLFSINFIFQRSFIANADYAGFRLVDLPSVSTGSMYDLNFFMVERPEGWRLSCEYDRALFDGATVTALLERLVAMMRAAVVDPRTLVSALPWTDVRMRHTPWSTPAEALAETTSEDAANVPRTVEVEVFASSPATASKVSTIAAEMLACDAVDIDGDLFAMGLHSLLAMRLLARIKRDFGVDVPLRSLFAAPTARGLADRIDVLREVLTPPPPPEPIILLNSGGTKPPLFFLYSDFTAEGLYCRRLAAALGPDQPFYIVAPHGTLGLPNMHSVEEMAVDYVDRLRAIQPHGPYRLSGFCLGGLVAYEIARLLKAKGEHVDRLILVNSVALPQRSLAAMDRLIRHIGLRANMSRKMRARLCFNLAWLHAVLVSNPLEMARLIGGRFAKLGNRRAPVWQMVEFPEATRLDTELAIASVNAASFTYHRKPYDGDITLLWGAKQDVPAAVPAREWREVARNVRLLMIQGGRSEPLNEDLGDLASALASALHG
jgi:thioesterase domain-containing protein/aryl carrier-like protein